MASEKLRVYKHGSSSYTDISSASAGGFSELTLTDVRNDAGLLEFTLRATTIAMMHAWMDEVAKVVWYPDGSTAAATFFVDEYTPRWSDLTATVKCLGYFSRGKGSPFTGTFEGVAIATALGEVIDAVDEWGAGTLGGTYTVAYADYADADAAQVIQELCALAGLTFWFDASGNLNTAASGSGIGTVAVALGSSCHEFTTTYTAREIINRVIVTDKAGAVFTYNDATSQVAYGIHVEKVSPANLSGSIQCAAYAGLILAAKKDPRREMTLEVDYDPDTRSGMLATVSGVGDSRTYQGIIQQATWRLGELWQELLVGYPPLTLPATKPVDPVPVEQATGGGGGSIPSGTCRYGTIQGDGSTLLDGDTNPLSPDPDVLLDVGTLLPGDRVAVIGVQA